MHVIRRQSVIFKSRNSRPNRKPTLLVIYMKETVQDTQKGQVQDAICKLYPQQYSPYREAFRAHIRAKHPRQLTHNASHIS